MTQTLTIAARMSEYTPSATMITFTAPDGITGRDLKSIVGVIEDAMPDDAHITGISLTETQENPEPPTSGIASRRKTK